MLNFYVQIDLNYLFPRIIQNSYIYNVLNT